MTDVLADRYELRGLLGTGGMARVYEGYDELLARRVAVKILRDDIASDPSLPERFLREARTAASFSHPNAVAVFDTGVHDGLPYIVMELVEGGRTLADELVERGALPAGEAVAIVGAVLDALAAAHDRGFVHRDVKPGNVLLPHDGGVKLADFGIAKELRGAAAGLTATGTVLGTPRYLAPEQVAGEPAVPATDVYATGIVLYELLAGTPPFDGDSAIAVALAHQRDPVPPLDERRHDLDVGLVAVVERALAKDPADRYLDAAAMRSALLDLPGAVRPLGDAAAATTVALSAAEPTTVLADDLGPGRGAPPRRWGRAALLGLLLVALLAAAVFAASQVGDGTVPDDAVTPSEPTEEAEDAGEPVPEPAPQDDPADPEPADPAPQDPAAQDPAPQDPAPQDPAPQDPGPTAPPAGPDDGAGNEGDGGGQGNSGEGNSGEGNSARGRGPDGEGPPGQDG